MATTYSVDLKFGARTRELDAAVSKLKGVDGAAEKLNGTLRDSRGRFIGAGQGARGLGNEAGKAVAPVRTLGAAVQSVLGPLAALDLARRYFKGFNEAERAAAEEVHRAACHPAQGARPREHIR